jgi:prevent-host-death family protein
MDTISYTAIRNNLAKTIDKVNENHAPVIITRQNGPAAVLMSRGRILMHTKKLPTCYAVRSMLRD